jgi:hypothetical protein
MGEKCPHSCPVIAATTQSVGRDFPKIMSDYVSGYARHAQQPAALQE